MMRSITSLSLLLLLLASCQPPRLQPVVTTTPSFAPQVTSTFTPTIPPTATPTVEIAPTVTIDTSLTPPMTREVAFAYHFWQARVIAFGGMDPAGRCNPCGETWIWDRSWTKLDPSHSPPARTGAAMAFDVANQAVLLFGGTAGQQEFNDTWHWQWDGEDWTQVHPDVAPSPRFNAKMIVDYARNQVVLWGGWHWDAERSDYTFFSDTWTWDGKTWTWRDVPGPMNGPIPPSSMAYDGNLKKVVMWQSGTGLWTWDGAAWEQQTIINGPDRDTEGLIGFDATRFHSHLVFRGSTIADPNPSATTWTFDGTTWTKVEGPVATEGNYQDAQMVYAFTHQALLYITPAGGKFGPYGLNVLAWDRSRSTWVDAATYEPPPPPVDYSNNMLDVSNRTDLAICVEVDDATAQGSLAEFRDTVQLLLDTKLSQKPRWKEYYAQFSYRVDAGCPIRHPSPQIVEIPSLYKLHLYVVDAAAAREIVERLKSKGMYFDHRAEAYEMFDDSPIGDNFSPVTIALYVTPDEMRNLPYLEDQLSHLLSLSQ